MKDYDLFNHFPVTEFVIDEPKRTIVCIITTKNDFVKKLEKYGFEQDAYSCWVKNPEIIQYIGMAKCNPEDKWDEDYGKRLAEFRASQERRSDLNNKINNYAKEVQRRIDNLLTYGRLKPSRRPKAPFDD